MSNVRDAMRIFKGCDINVTHIEPVPKAKWCDVLAQDTLSKAAPCPWKQPTALWEVYTEGSMFFNNREYTEWFVVVENRRMWLCHYAEHDSYNVTTIVAELHTL